MRFQNKADDGTVTIYDLDVANATATVREEVKPSPARSALELEADRYELLELIGRGGFADVVRARDRRVGRVVALKIPRGLDRAAGLEAEGRLGHGWFAS